MLTQEQITDLTSTEFTAMWTGDVSHEEFDEMWNGPSDSDLDASSGTVINTILDGRGSVMGLIKSNALAMKVKYSAWGDYSEDVIDGTLVAVPENSHYLDFGFSGKFIEPCTGLLHTHYRDLDVRLNRWDREDPAGIIDGLNPFHNHEEGANWIDYTGEDVIKHKGRTYLTQLKDLLLYEEGRIALGMYQQDPKLLNSGLPNGSVISTAIASARGKEKRLTYNNGLGIALDELQGPFRTKRLKDYSHYQVNQLKKMAIDEITTSILFGGGLNLGRFGVKKLLEGLGIKVARGGSHKTNLVLGKELSSAEGQIVYRNIPKSHPAIKEAKRGVVRPWGDKYELPVAERAIMHDTGGTFGSGFTSWSVDINWALSRQKRLGGVVIRVKAPKGSIWKNEATRGAESQVLVPDVVVGEVIIK